MAETFEKIRNVTLLNIDPITAYLGEVDSHRTAPLPYAAGLGLRRRHQPRSPPLAAGAFPFSQHL